MKLCLQALRTAEMEIPACLWAGLVQYENDGGDPEAYKSRAGYVFSPYDGARSIAEIVLGGLLDPERLARMDSIHHFDSTAPASSEIISALVKNAFGVGAVSSQPKASDLSDVVENELADRLMILAADDSATAEVRSQAWVGVNGIYAQVKTSRRPAASNIARQIEAFIRDPRQNVPKLRPSTAPP